MPAPCNHDSAPWRKGLLEALGRLPSDEAFRLMLERCGNTPMRAALRDTMGRFPVRAVRVLDGVLEACDGRSPAAFGWALFRDWREDGAPPKDACSEPFPCGLEGAVPRVTSGYIDWRA